jgi:predicted regulator of Ras-like GTPase activity (Roadblock/LC7/MglB family)
MKPIDLARGIEAVKPPVERFIREARVRIVLLVNGAGQVLAQHGFTRSYEVANVASLAASAHASASALADIVHAGRWAHLHHAGRERQLFLAPFRTPTAELILVAIFDGDSSLGMVQLFFDRLAAEVADLPEFREAARFSTAEGFERELEAGLRRLFDDGVREA